MNVKRFTATLDFEDDGEDVPDELPQEVPVYRVNWGEEGDVRVGMARDLRYTGSADEDGFRYVKAEMNILDPEPDELYSLFPPQGGDGWRIYAL